MATANKNPQNFGEFAKEVRDRKEVTVMQPEYLDVWESGNIDGMDEALELMEKAERSSYKKGKHKWKQR